MRMAYLYFTDMKKLMICFVLLLCSGYVMAQKDSLQMDENNTYVYYKVVNQVTVPETEVYRRAWDFARNLNRNSRPEKGQAEHAFNISGSFLVYSGTSLMRKESGAVSYLFNFQATDGRYRFKFGNFKFIPYKRDRYGNMVPVSGISTPIEKLADAYTQKERDVYFDQIAANCIYLDKQLKQAIYGTEIKKVPAKTIKVNTGKW